jgi:hypothetical protein
MVLTISQNVFLDKSRKPTASRLASVIGAKFGYWEELKSHIQKTHGPVREEWKYYGKTLGWTRKLFLGKRNLLFITACNGFFRIAIVFGDKAVAAVQQSTLPEKLVQQLVSARKYAEGRGLTLEVKSRQTLKHILMLIDIKVAH